MGVYGGARGGAGVGYVRGIVWAAGGGSYGVFMGCLWSVYRVCLRGG